MGIVGLDVKEMADAYTRTRAIFGVHFLLHSEENVMVDLYIVQKKASKLFEVKYPMLQCVHVTMQ